MKHTVIGLPYERSFLRGAPKSNDWRCSDLLNMKQEKAMLPSTLKGIPFKIMIPVCMAMTLMLFPSWASADEDPCSKTGIYVLNQSQLGAWFTRNEGLCTYWTRHYLITIKPEDAVTIYGDRDCRTSYYSENPTYDDYKSVDANRDCRVRILLDRTLSDL